MKIGFFEILTLILVIAKLLGFFEADWWLVLLPATLDYMIKWLILIFVDKFCR